MSSSSIRRMEVPVNSFFAPNVASAPHSPCGSGPRVQETRPVYSGSTRWSTEVSVGPDSGVLRDQICTNEFVLRAERRLRIARALPFMRCFIVRVPVLCRMQDAGCRFRKQGFRDQGSPPPRRTCPAAHALFHCLSFIFYYFLLFFGCSEWEV